MTERSAAEVLDELDEHARAAAPATFLDFTIDWADLFSSDHRDAGEWLVEPFLADRHAHALYAPAKAGKSLLALAVAAAVATGRPILARPRSEPLPVIYCDYEMQPDDILERLEALGYNDPAELAHLHYVMLPDVAALDTAAGGTTLAVDIERTGARLVVIDTTGRAVGGPENESDTYLAFSRHTGRRLRRLDCTWLRLDHAGKNLKRGQRGTSAKNDDVDIVWQLTADETRLDLTATHRRMGWVPHRLQILKRVDGFDLHLEMVDTAWPLGTNDLADTLDRLALPLGISVRKARAALRDAGETASNETLVAALKWRRERSNDRRERDTPETPTTQTAGGSRAFRNPATVTLERSSPNPGNTAPESGTENDCPTCGGAMKADGYCPTCEPER